MTTAIYQITVQLFVSAIPTSVELECSIPQAVEGHFRTLEVHCSQLREFETKLRQATANRKPVRADELLQSFDAQSKVHPSDMCALCQYYRGRLLILAGKKSDARDQLKRVPIGPITSEVLSTLKELAMLANEPTTQDALSVLLGTLLPLGADGATQDGVATARSALGDFPVIPVVNEEKLRMMAEHFWKMQMYDRAATANKELVYGTSMQARVLDPTRRDESWLSPAAVGLWLRVAESEWHCGRANVAAEYLAKCIVFGAESDKDAAIKLLHEISRSESAKPPKRAPVPDRAKLLEIVKRYAEMNMHPRALELLREFRETIGDEAEVQHAKFRKEWERIIRAYSSFSDRAVVFGQEVYSKERGFNFDVTIPPPLRPEALEEVRKAFARDRNQK